MNCLFFQLELTDYLCECTIYNLFVYKIYRQLNEFENFFKKNCKKSNLYLHLRLKYMHMVEVGRCTQIFFATFHENIYYANIFSYKSSTIKNVFRN